MPRNVTAMPPPGQRPPRPVGGDLPPFVLDVARGRWDHWPLPDVTTPAVGAVLGRGLGSTLLMHWRKRDAAEKPYEDQLHDLAHVLAALIEACGGALTPGRRGQVDGFAGILETVLRQARDR